MGGVVSDICQGTNGAQFACPVMTLRTTAVRLNCGEAYILR